MKVIVCESSDCNMVLSDEGGDVPKDRLKLARTAFSKLEPPSSLLGEDVAEHALLRELRALNARLLGEFANGVWGHEGAR